MLYKLFSMHYNMFFLLASVCCEQFKILCRLLQAIMLTVRISGLKPAANSQLFNLQKTSIAWGNSERAVKQKAEISNGIS